MTKVISHAICQIRAHAHYEIADPTQRGTYYTFGYGGTWGTPHTLQVQNSVDSSQAFSGSFSKEGSYDTSSINPSKPGDMTAVVALTNGCCAVFEHGVSCCLHPDQVQHTTKSVHKADGWMYTRGKVMEGVSGHAADFLLFSNLLLTRLQPRRARRWGTCMDLPQLGPVAVLLLKSGKSVVCPETPPRLETPSVTLSYIID